MLLIKTAYRKYFEAVTTPTLYFLCENMSLKIEEKESVLLWLPASDGLLYLVTTETGLPPTKPEYQVLELFITLCSHTKQHKAWQPQLAICSVKYTIIRVNSTSAGSKG